jgi:hypothetical protein
MRRKFVHRGLAALVFVTLLTLVGAQPAAAVAGPGFLGDVSNLWSAVTGSELWDVLSGWFGGTTEESATAKRGGGIDPNGNSSTPELDPPTMPCDEGCGVW